MRAFRDPLLICIIVLSLLLGLAVLNRGHDWGDDFASYIMQAKSIWTGTMPEFVEHNRFTITQSSIVIGPVAYPWGYPLILVPAYALKGTSALALKLPGLMFFIGFLVVLFLLTKDRLTRTGSLLLVSLFAFNPLLVDFHNQILSDIPFLFFSTLALWLMVRRDRSNPRAAILLGVVIAAAFFIRTQGILLLGSYGLAALFRLWKNRVDREVAKSIIRALLLVCGSFGLLWLVYALIFPGGGESYFSQYKDFRLEKVFGYLRGYFRVFSEFFGEAYGWEYLYYFLFAFFLVGLWNRRKTETVFIVFYAVWMLLLASWPAWQGPRFIFPLLPVFFYFVFQGMEVVIQKFAEKPRAWIQRGATAFWLVIIGMFLFQSGVQAWENLTQDRKPSSAFEPFSMDMYEFIREKTAPESVIVFFKPRAMRLFTERDSYMALTCAELTRGDYVVINHLAENSQVPEDEVDECGIPLQVVFENRRFLVFKLLK